MFLSLTYRAVPLPVQLRNMRRNASRLRPTHATHDGSNATKRPDSFLIQWQGNTASRFNNKTIAAKEFVPALTFVFLCVRAEIYSTWQTGEPIRVRLSRHPLPQGKLCAGRGVSCFVITSPGHSLFASSFSNMRRNASRLRPTRTKFY